MSLVRLILSRPHVPERKMAVDTLSRLALSMPMAQGHTYVPRAKPTVAITFKESHNIIDFST